jgi:hypothetical protein
MNYAQTAFPEMTASQKALIRLGNMFKIVGLLASEWVILGHFRPFLRGKTELLMSCRSRTISRWQNYDGVEPSGMHIASPALCRR